MAIELRLTQKQIQKLALTPQMRLAIRLLQLPLLELRTVLENEMMENPVLEETGEAETEQSENAGKEDIVTADNPEPAQMKEQTEITDELQFKEQFDRLAASDELWRESFHGGTSLLDSEESQRRHDLTINQSSQTETLAEHLNWQLSLSDIGEEEQKIGRHIIGNINENGYLDDTIEEIALACECPVSRVEKVLDIIRTFDPVGIASRSLRECLLAQLEYYHKQNTLAYKIVDLHLKKLEKRQFAQIAREFKVPLEHIREAKDIIAGLEPKPGRLYNNERPQYIVPDIKVQPTENGFSVLINERELPHLRISSFYRNLMSKNDTDLKTKEYIEKKVKSGLWLIKSIRQRQITLQKITEEILSSQADFLASGPDYLKPLTLKEVATATNLHESTVSRVVANKYIETPQGIFSLKQFFSGKVKTTNGDFRSQKSVQTKIAEMIRNEDSGSPLSDARIAGQLHNDGINIARRTVAKYRQEMKILPANLRKSC